MMREYLEGKSIINRNLQNRREKVIKQGDIVNIMDKEGAVYPKDLLAIIVIVFGSLGFLLWGLGISSLGNQMLRWIGSIIVGLIGLLIAILEKWLK